MKDLSFIAEELFNKVRGRFPSVTIGNEKGEVTNVPSEARFFDFEYKEGAKTLGKISMSLDENSIAVMYTNDFVANEDQMTKDNWYNFLKELRMFSKKRLLNFDTRNITKSNLDKRDYKFLAQNRGGEGTMTESKLYGTSKVSYQDFDGARLMIKHTESINQELATGRTQKIGAIYVESAEGERFKYPYKHLSGARAMARHVAEGGLPYDDFGSHITSLSEELSKLRKFKNYMGRSAVMAESLSVYMDVVKERIATVKKTVENLQKPKYYKEAIEGFETAVLEDVPSDVAENWIDQLTIKQFNEELADVFPYIYKLVSEATKAKELGPDDLAEDEPRQPYQELDVGDEYDTSDRRIKGTGSLDRVQGPANTVKVRPGMTIFSIAQMFNDQNNMGGDVQDFVKEIMAMNNISNPQSLQVGQVLEIPYSMGTGPDGASRGLPPGGFTNYESQIENEFEEMMGQFSEANNDCDETCPKSCPDCGGTGDPEKYKEMQKDEGDDDTMDVKINSKGQMMKADEPDAEEQKTPLGEFILSYFDYTTGQFPKGETAILTMVEKDYGERFIEPAKQFIERINSRVAEVMGYKEEEPVVQDNTELDAIRSLAGV